MSTYNIHTKESAPDASKPLLEGSEKAFGMIPNLHAVMAESPELLQAYQVVHELFMKSGFTPEELTVVWQTINVENECHYCVPAHTAIAHTMGVHPEITDALRNGTTLTDEKLEALRTFTTKLMRKHGQVSQDVINSFTAAGYTQKHILAVILGYSQKIMSNYTNHVAETPLDPPFQKFEWHKA